MCVPNLNRQCGLHRQHIAPTTWNRHRERRASVSLLGESLPDYWSWRAYVSSPLATVDTTRRYPRRHTPACNHWHHTGICDAVHHSSTTKINVKGSHQVRAFIIY
jgi:hypothetical protein